MSQFVEVLTGISDYIPDPNVMTFPFECDNFQKFSFKSIQERKNILVTVPTSSGKTTVAEYAIVYNVKILNKKVVYTSPIKSLSNEKYNDFKKRFEPYGITIGLLTGDNKIDVNSDCLIATAEILRNSLYKLEIPNTENKEVQENQEEKDKITNDFIDSIGCVIMDEIHFMNDEDRGRVWEETIILLDREIQLIMLSATISNAIKFASWIGNCKQKTISLIQADKRIIPLQHNIFVDNKLYKILDGDDYDSSIYHIAKREYNKRQANRKTKGFDMNALHELVLYLQKNNLFQAIFFSFSKDNCEKYAHEISNKLVDHKERSKIETIFNQKLSKYSKTYEQVKQYNDLKELLPKGIAYHHGGLLPIFKEIVEILFKEGFIKILFATETFAVGVNMPTRTVVFTETSKYTKNGKRALNTAEYKQMSGRAGRRGLDTSGNVIILPLNELIDETDFRSIALGHVPSINSQFKWDYQFYLKVIQTQVISLDTFFEKSLINVDNKNCLIKEIEEEDKLNKIILEYQTKIELYDEDSKNKLNKILNYENKIFNKNAFIKLSKQQQKEYDTLINELNKTPETSNLYKLQKDLNMYSDKLEITKNRIIDYNNFVGQSSNDISKILESWEYIKDGKTTIKGVIASQINECNAIILTELLIGDYFSGLNAEEIIGLLSIFCEPIKGENINCEIENDNIYERIVSLENLIEESMEQEYSIGRFQSDWAITKTYINIAYKWAEGYDIIYILKLLEDYGEYEGNFVRNMLRLYNISINLKAICKMINKNELLPELEKIDGLILRDIVNVNSIYLGI